MLLSAVQDECTICSEIALDERAPSAHMLSGRGGQTKVLDGRNEFLEITCLVHSASTSLRCSWSMKPLTSTLSNARHTNHLSFSRCQSVVLNMWSVTLHNNRRIICSLFHRWGEEGLPLGGALAAVRGDAAVKPRARFCTVLYGLPTLKYGP